jgi:hypothetical protein
MKKLTKEQTDKLYGYCSTNEKTAILCNGQTGYCPETKMIITCCGNCGEYRRVTVDWRKLR